MATIALIVNGVEYNLSSLYDYAGHDGLGMSPSHRLSNRGPQQHGDTDVGFRLDPRVFRLFFGLDGATLSDLYDLRDGVLRLFRPSNDALKMKWTLDNGEVRQLDAHYVGDMGMPSASKRGYYQDLVVMMKAPDPTFYHPVEASVVFALGGGSDAFEIPLAIPWAIGVSTLDQTRTISYEGSWYAFPIITVVGPITDAIITNQTTGESLDFTGTTIDAGDYYEIDCRYGYKTVVDSNGTSRVADLTADSDLATFHLEPPGGQETTKENDINVAGNTVTEATEVYLRYKVRYVGI